MIASGGTNELTSAGNGAINDEATVQISAGGKMKLGDGVTERIKELYLGGQKMWPGTWGSTSSSAKNRNDTYFAAGFTGVLAVPNTAGAVLIIR